MSDKQTQIDKENVTIGCYISLALAIVFFLHLIGIGHCVFLRDCCRQ